MSNVKVNGNAYNGVNSIRLPLADDTGYATFEESAATAKDWVAAFMGTAELGNIENNSVTEVDISPLARRTVGTVSFPNAGIVKGDANKVKAANLLFPRASQLSSSTVFVRFSLKNAVITGVVDLRNAVGSNSFNQTFMSAQIGTLLIGKIPEHNGIFQGANITNLVWNNPDLTAAKIAGVEGLASSGASITNAYVPDTLYDDILALKTGGTLTTVTNLYRVSEWSND